MLCKPFFRLKYRIRAVTFVLPILLTAPVYTLPRFFEVESYNNNSYVWWHSNITFSSLLTIWDKSFHGQKLFCV
jgi:hypothetical protein